MKTSKLYFLAVAFLALSISMVSCSGDDGEAGLLGPKGDKGEQGVAGAVGPAGTDGSIIYSGEGEPAVTVGVVGDYYLDIATGMLYGPKQVDNSWADVDGFSLKGIDGQDGTNGTDGADGNETLSGSGAPTAEDGELGDFYLDTETAILYGPKSNRGVELFGGTGWGAGLELKGADGNANVKSFNYTASVSSWVVYSNNEDSFTKTIIEDIDFPALNEDVYENGIVLVYWKDVNSVRLLPLSKLTSQNNFLTREGWIFKNSSDGRYILRLQNTLKGIANTTELITVADTEFQIKVITGQVAIQLKANKDNQLEFDRLVDNLED